MSNFSQFFSSGASSAGVPIGSIVPGRHAGNPSMLPCDGVSTAPAPNADLGYVLPTVTGAQPTQLYASMTSVGVSPLYLAYGAGVWVAMGRRGDGSSAATELVTSADGVNWTTRLAGWVNSTTFSALAGSPTGFVASSDDGNGNTYFHYSSDGFNWTSVASGSNGYAGCGALAISGSRVVGVPRYSGYSSGFISDTAGVTWSTFNLGGQFVPTHTQGVFHNGAFYFGGYFQGTPTRMIVRGTDVTYANTAGGSIVTGMASNGTVLVAVSSTTNQTATSSDNGATWTPRTVPGLASVAWTGSQFVAAAYAAPGFYTSPDGVTWTALAASHASFSANTNQQAAAGPSSVLFADVFASPQTVVEVAGSTVTVRALPRPSSSVAGAMWFGAAGLYVAYGNTAGAYGNRISTSPDGSTWTARGVTSVTSVNGWVAGATSPTTAVLLGTSMSTAAYSTDGVAWRLASLPAAAPWQAIAFGAGLFVAVRSDSSNYATSPDGVTWTARSGLPMSFPVGIAHNGSVFLLIGANGETATSANGTTWTNGANQGVALGRVAAFGSTFIVSHASSGNYVLTTATGTGTFTQSTLPGPPGTYAYPAASGSLVVLVSGNAQGHYFTSATGASGSWTQRTIGDGTLIPYAAASNGSGFVTFGSGTDKSGAAVSADGISWATRTFQQAPSTGYPIRFARGGGVSLCVAYYSTSSSVLVQTDGGAAWRYVRMPMPPGATWVYWGAVTYGAGLFVAMGQTSTGASVVATSPDGYAWTLRTAPAFPAGTATTYWTKVVWSGSTFLAVTNSNVGATSPDGVTWTVRTLPFVPFVPTYSSSNGGGDPLAFGSGLFLLLPTSNSASAAAPGMYATSPDGVTWTTRYMPRTSPMCVASDGSVFVVTLYGSIVTLRSPDGVSWTPAIALNYAGSGTVSWFLEWTGSAFVAYSQQGVRISRDGTGWSRLANIGPALGGGQGAGSTGPLTACFVGLSAGSFTSLYRTFDVGTVMAPPLDGLQPFYEYSLVIA